MYKVRLTNKFTKSLHKLNKTAQSDVMDWINNNLENIENPRSRGKPLTGNFKGLWRYRIGNYRLVCEILDNQLVILAVEIGDRKEIYKLLNR